MSNSKCIPLATPSVIVKSESPSTNALADPEAIWLGFTLYTVPSVTSSNIKKSLDVSTVIPEPSVKLDGSTVRLASPLAAPPAKPEFAAVLTAVISPTPLASNCVCMSDVTPSNL